MSKKLKELSEDELLYLHDLLNEREETKLALSVLSGEDNLRLMEKIRDLLPKKEETKEEEEDLTDFEELDNVLPPKKTKKKKKVLKKKVVEVEVDDDSDEEEEQFTPEDLEDDD